MFAEFALPDALPDAFRVLAASAVLEQTGKGRRGAVLLDDRDGRVPLVRTTTAYQQPSQRFSSAHYQLMDAICAACASATDTSFNNGLLVIYTPQYRTMGYHSDQATDLDEKSSICLFSCYSDPAPRQPELRRLRIKAKDGGDSEEIVLRPNSVVVFSVATNRQHLHAIVAGERQGSDSPDLRWLGLTLRRSRTFVVFHLDERAYFDERRPLVLADQEQRKQFYKWRALENKSVDFVYPDVDFTVSAGDTLRPVAIAGERKDSHILS